MTTTRLCRALAAGSLLAAVAACAPTVKIEAPDKPIEINLNIRIEQEVRVKLDRDLDKAFQEDPALFGTAPTKGKAQ
ncbi:MAG TPA: YnbE family lipoprotein [Azospirillum sp.]|nr:YnbE family lipoprotein [Azospirillum sp.]